MDPVLELVERSNQRGGRMLSVPDLVAAGTLTATQAAWLLSRIEAGSSWLVGARPGGAGKTTIMSALLAMLPPGETPFLTADGSGWKRAMPPACLVSYELSPGGYLAYIWNGNVKRLLERAAAGCRVVSNLHADTLGEAREQICGVCGASESAFGAFDLFLPIRLDRHGMQVCRRVERIFAFESERWREADPAAEADERARGIETFLEDCLDKKRLRCGEVRAAWLRWLADHPRA